MIRYENQCVDCGFSCRYEACRYYRVRILECDNCGDEVGKLYIGVSGKELCDSCVLEELEVIE